MKNSKSLISIVMPVYNEEIHLDACLRSIVKQTITDWELLAVDDFSTDRSFEILKQWSLKDARIRIFRNAEKGIIPALQLALEKSAGNFITRMDADDIMRPDKLVRLRQLLEENSACQISTGGVAYFSDNLLRDGFIKYQDWLNGFLDGSNHFEEVYKECVIPSPCWMMAKDDLLKLGGFGQLIYPEDYDLVFKAYQARFSICSTREVLHEWRDHPLRASRTDPHYADQLFAKLKVGYFSEIDYDREKELFLWGCGPKGKSIAKVLIEAGLSFRWVCNNQKKIGHFIYDIEIEELGSLGQVKEKQVIVGVSGKTFKNRKREMYLDLGISGQDLYEFV